ncbi:hypothetical protein ACF0H5_012890 [Mactra antiquata]
MIELDSFLRNNISHKQNKLYEQHHKKLIYLKQLKASQQSEPTIDLVCEENSSFISSGTDTNSTITVDSYTKKENSSKYNNNRKCPNKKGSKCMNGNGFNARESAPKSTALENNSDISRTETSTMCSKT